MKRIALPMLTIAILSACSSSNTHGYVPPDALSLSSTPKTAGTMPAIGNMIGNAVASAKEGTTTVDNGLSISSNSERGVRYTAVTSDDGNASLGSLRFGDIGLFGLTGTGTANDSTSGLTAQYSGKYDYSLLARDQVSGVPSKTGIGDFNIALDVAAGTGTLRSTGDLQMSSDNLAYNGTTGDFTGDLAVTHGADVMTGTTSGMTAGAGGLQILGVFGAQNDSTLVYGGIYGTAPNLP